PIPGVGSELPYRHRQEWHHARCAQPEVESRLLPRHPLCAATARRSPFPLAAAAADAVQRDPRCHALRLHLLPVLRRLQPERGLLESEWCRGSGTPHPSTTLL
ncbi:hypothetical protein LTR53_019274, partial [Teratosphaeriaceae sp. CCFEE 6253]